MPLIVIEGPDFSGKSTLAKQLYEDCFPAQLLHEPGSTKLTEHIRLGMKSYPMQIDARQLIMHGCRLDLVGTENLWDTQDRLVILDRYVPSTIVYGVTDGIPLDTLQNLFHLFPVPVPDVTFVLVPHLETILGRFAMRSGLDALEGSRERIIRIYQNYKALAHNFPGMVHIIEEHNPYPAIREILLSNPRYASYLYETWTR